MNSLKFKIRNIAVCFIAMAFTDYGSALAYQDPTDGDADDTPVVFVRVSQSGSRPIVGIVVNDDASQITVRDLKTGEVVSIRKAASLTIKKPLDINEAARYAGLSTVVGWKMKQLAERKPTVGKIATVTPQAIYITLGESAGLKVGQKLTVYRNDGNILHPDTGEVLGSRRSKIAHLEVIEVDSSLSKTRLIVADGLDVKLEIGYEVEPETNGMIVAVSPLYHEDGNLTNVGASIAEDLTTALVQAKIAVVERSVIGPALAELMVQNTSLFDEKTSQQFGKLTGATYVLSGKIVPDGTKGTAYVRLNNVATGKILFAISTPVDLSKAQKVSSARRAMPSTPKPVAKESTTKSDTKDSSTKLVGKETVFKMAGKKAWEDSGIHVEKGQLVSITAPEIGPNYNKKVNYYGINTYVASLLARIDGKIVEIDKGKDFTAPASGTIYFRQNLKASANQKVDVTVKVFEADGSADK
jgi:TolB-like protein